MKKEPYKISDFILKEEKNNIQFDAQPYKNKSIEK